MEPVLSGVIKVNVYNWGSGRKRLTAVGRTGPSGRTAPDPADRAYPRRYATATTRPRPRAENIASATTRNTESAAQM